MTTHAIQQTSREAFINEVKPTLGHRQRVIFEEICKAGNLTNSEIAARLGWTINTVTPRVFELRQRGYVSQFEERECRVTGRTCIAWYASQRTLFDL